MQEATVPVSATKDKTDTLSQAACATASTHLSVVRSRPAQTSAGKAPVLLKNEYPYPQWHLYGYQASNEVAACRPPSQKAMQGLHT